MAFDIVLKGGHIIDPKNGVDAVLDVALSSGKIAAVAADLPTEDVGRCIDVSGLYVVPGLVDIHMHAYATPGHRDAWAGDNSILPDGFSFRTGVTTMVDTGSAGWRNFEDFRHRVIDRVRKAVPATRAIDTQNQVDAEILTRDALGLEYSVIPATADAVDLDSIDTRHRFTYRFLVVEPERPSY